MFFFLVAADAIGLCKTTFWIRRISLFDEKVGRAIGPCSTLTRGSLLIDRFSSALLDSYRYLQQLTPAVSTRNIPANVAFIIAL